MPISSRRTAAAIAALAALTFMAPGADAKKPTPQLVAPVADACGYTATTVFSAWHDKRGYALLPDGGFENSASGWTLHGGAAAGEGNETFLVGGPADHQSLSLPAGSSATSPATCVSRHDGTIRLFARTSGDRTSRLKVDVLYTTTRGKHRALRVAKLRAGEAWSPTRKLPVVLGRAKAHGRLTTASIRVRFTPVGAPADWQIDDVYLDPRLRQ